MSRPVREGRVRLLADSRSADPRVRLAQAVARADFLLHVSRTVSAVQNPMRALEALVGLLVDELVEVAQVVVRMGRWELHGSAVEDRLPRSGSTPWVGDRADGFDEIIRRGMPEEIVLAASGSKRRSILAELLVDESLIEEVDRHTIEHVLVLPLSARGRPFGLLVLGRDGGFGFGGSRAFLEDLAERVAIGLDATLVVAESTYVASVLRRSLAPVEMPKVPGMELATYYRVAHQSEDVGGDFFDVHGPDEDLVLVCGDVAGKGIEAAVHAKRIRSAVRTSSLVSRDPGWILDLVNRVLVAEAEGPSEALATTACARLRQGTASLRADIASAGHPPAMVVRTDGAVEEVSVGGVALAVDPGSDYDETTVWLGAHDTLVLYTDGVTGARGADGPFGDERLRTQLRRLAGMPARAMVESVALAVSEHLGDRPHDDIALIAVQFRPEER